MFPNTHQHFYKVKPSVSLPQPLLIYSPQTQFVNLPVLFSYGFQSSYQNNQFILNNSLPYFAKQEIPNVPEYKQNLPSAIPQKEFDNKNVLNKTMKLKPHLHNASVKKIKSRNNCSSNFVFVDISHIEKLPPQEKLSLEQLRKPKRRFKLWTEEEDQLLLKLKKNSDLNWREIAARFPTRTLNACQYRINKLKNTKNMKSIKEKTLNLTI